MFSKILIAHRGVRATGADASVAGKRAPEAELV
jgi:hypothetical protein